MYEPIAWYREFEPCTALQADIYAYFSFLPGRPATRSSRALRREIPFFDATFCSPQFADGHVSIVFELGRVCGADGRWVADGNTVSGTATGPMTRVGRTEGSDRPEMLGVYFRPARGSTFLRVAMSELIDSTTSIDCLWGSVGSYLPTALCDLDEESRIDLLESVLLQRLVRSRQRPRPIDVHGLATRVCRLRGQVTVARLARAAGVSRQYLTRAFREEIGMGPKLYSRVARFQSGLRYTGSRATVDWALAATAMGYADQSHMIAEFRQFSGLTPQALANREWFHPFIERAKSGADAPVRSQSTCGGNANF